MVRDEGGGGRCSHVRKEATKMKVGVNEWLLQYDSSLRISEKECYEVAT